METTIYPTVRNQTRLTFQSILPYNMVVLIVVVLVVFCSIALLANLYIIHVICKNKTLRTLSFYGIVNLAIANMILVVLFPLLPITFLLTFDSPLQHSTILILVLCGLLLPILLMAFTASNTTLAIICLLKYQATASNIESVRSHNRYRKVRMLLVPWLIGLLQQIPRTIITYQDSRIIKLCTFYTDVISIQVCTLVLASVNLIIPSAVMIVSHIKIVRKLQSLHRCQASYQILSQIKSNYSKNRLSQNYRTRGAFKLLLITTILQIVCSLLWLIGFYISILAYASNQSPYIIAFGFLILSFGLVASALQSPILYILFLPKFRQPLQYWFTSFISIYRTHRSRINISG